MVPVLALGWARGEAVLLGRPNAAVSPLGPEQDLQGILRFERRYCTRKKHQMKLNCEASGLAFMLGEESKRRKTRVAQSSWW